MNKFQYFKEYEESGVSLPERKTRYSAGYDFEVAEDTLVPSYHELMGEFIKDKDKILTLEEITDLTKKYKCKPTLVPTGVTCQLDDDKYLQLSVRSSAPLKSWLILANGIGIIDSDYFPNQIYFQLINLSPYPILLKKGDIIGQGVILSYHITEDDRALGIRKGGFGSTSK